MANDDKKKPSPKKLENNDDQAYRLNKVIIGVALQTKSHHAKKMIKLIEKIQLIKLGELVRIKIHNARAHLFSFGELNLKKLELICLEKDQLAIFLGMESSDPNMCICKILIGSKIFWVSPSVIEEVK